MKDLNTIIIEKTDLIKNLRGKIHSRDKKIKVIESDNYELMAANYSLKKEVELKGFQVEEMSIEVTRLRKELRLFKNQSIDNEMIGGYFAQNIS